ncbi:unnamed protein product [Polarella glacialis]|uniref:Acyltransferase 3 domain-containing protein n=1 Tax=Polarella glacialis TaxID=89957 RepID=A0A813EQT1_POLGL|nr:unnamed protein product [Polarella glacialis]
MAASERTDFLTHGCSWLLLMLENATGSDLIDSAMRTVEADSSSSTNQSNWSFSPLRLAEFKATGAPLAILELAILCSRRGRLTDSTDVELAQGSVCIPPANLNLHLLEVFRFIGIIHIVFFHEGLLRAWDSNFLGSGKYWVQFFFVLSGCVLYHSQARRGESKVAEFGAFLSRRLKSTYPGYVLGTCMALAASSQPLLATRSYFGQGLLPGFFMVDTWFYPYGATMPNGPAWFVCTLFFFWLCFPRWYSFIHTFSYPRCACVLAWLSSFGLPMVHVAFDVVPGFFSEFHPLANWPSFVFGLALGRLAGEIDFEWIPALLLKTLGSAALAVLFAVFALLSPASIGAWVSFLDRGPVLLPVFATLILFVSAGQDVLLSPRLLSSAPARWLGQMSSQLFLLHWPTRLLLNKADSDLPLVITVGVQMVVASLFHTLLQFVLA